MKVLAHRGSMKLAPQNTMPAFALAWKSGAQGIELDVQCSKDSVPIVFHDDRLDKLTNATGPVRNKTLAELKSLDAGSHFSSQWKGEQIPTLEEVLRARPKNSLVNIEIKTEIEFDPYLKKFFTPWRRYPPLQRNASSEREQEARRTARCLADCLKSLFPEYPDLRTSLIISSFDPIALEAFKKELPEIPIGFLYCYEVRRDTRPLMKEIDYQAEHIAVLETSKKNVTRARAKQKAVTCWTVNKSQQVRRLFRLGVDTIITNYPKKMTLLVKKLQLKEKPHEHRI